MKNSDLKEIIESTSDDGKEELSWTTKNLKFWIKLNYYSTIVNDLHSFV